MQPLWIAAILGGAYLGYKKYSSKPEPVPNPFGLTGCTLDIPTAKRVVDLTIRPLYERMKHKIYMVASDHPKEYGFQFMQVWDSLNEAAVAPYTGLFVQRSCSEEDYQRAFEQFGGLVACMMVRDLMEHNHIDEEPEEVAKLCAEEPQEVFRIIRDSMVNPIGE